MKTPKPRATMGFLSLIVIMPTTWDSMGHEAKAKFLARVLSTGLVTGIVCTAGGHVCGAIVLSMPLTCTTSTSCTVFASPIQRGSAKCLSTTMASAASSRANACALAHSAAGAEPGHSGAAVPLPEKES